MSDTPRKHNLVEAERDAARFEQVRKAHQTEVAEDYVELIADLIDAQGEARVVELAERMGVSHATVNKVLARLNREGLVQTRPYRSIFLTAEGESLALECKERHRRVLAFLKAIGVRDEVAELDAEGVEHHVSDETLDAFDRLTDRLTRGAPPAGKDAP